MQVLRCDAHLCYNKSDPREKWKRELICDFRFEVELVAAAAIAGGRAGVEFVLSCVCCRIKSRELKKCESRREVRCVLCGGG